MFVRRLLCCLVKCQVRKDALHLPSQLRCFIPIICAKETRQLTQRTCRIRNPVHRNIQYPSSHYTTTYLIVD
jgi:hypothetical protein